MVCSASVVALVALEHCLQKILSFSFSLYRLNDLEFCLQSSSDEMEGKGI